MKGLIVEKEEHYYIVLTPTGAYKKIKGSTEKAIGQEIHINNTFSISKIISMAAALLVIILLSQAFLRIPSQQPIFAYVTLDINPSVEFAIDKDYLVLQAAPLNAEAKELLSKIEYSGRDIDMVLADFTQAAILGQYIAEDKENYVVVSYCPAVLDESAEVHLDEITRKQREVIQSYGQEVEIDTLIIDTDVKEKAKELGISISKLKGNKNGQSENSSAALKEAKQEKKEEKQNTKNEQKDLRQQEKTIEKELKQEEKENKKLEKQEKQEKSNNSRGQNNKGTSSFKKDNHDGVNAASDNNSKDDKTNQKNNGNKNNKKIKEDKIKQKESKQKDS